MLCPKPSCMSVSLQPKIRWNHKKILNFEGLRPRAQRQIESLHRRMEASGKRSFYLDLIKNVVLYEQNRAIITRRGEEID